MDNIKTVSQCRLCDSTDIIEILNFGEVCLANALKSAEDLDKPEFAAPLRVFLCNNCNSIQLFDEVSPDILFGNGYNYSSPPNLVPHFKEYAKTTTEKVLGKNEAIKNDFILGIGSNNGLLEKEYQNLGYWNVVGVEPAENIAKLAEKEGVVTINEFFTPELAAGLVVEVGQKFKLVTCNNCLAHISQINDIITGVKVLLEQSGTFVFENAYWLNNIFNKKCKDIGQVYSEHIFYHSIKPLKQFFSKHNLELYDVQLNSVQLGSFRCFVGWPRQHEISSSVDNLIKLEGDLGLYRLETYEELKRDTEYSKAKLLNKLESIKSKYPNRSIALYGVPAKIVLLIKVFELEKYIDYALDDSPLKYNKIIPGTEIPIYSSIYWKHNEPAATIIGAYNFSEDVIKNNPDYKGEWISVF